MMSVLIRDAHFSSVLEMYFDCCTMPIPRLTAFRQVISEDNNYLAGVLDCRSCGKEFLTIEIDW